MKQGDKVVCINLSPWRNSSGKVFDGPKYDDVLVIYKICSSRETAIIPNAVMYQFKEYPNDCFYSKAFVPLADWEEATAFLESIKKVDQPVMDHSQDAKGYMPGPSKTNS